MGIFGQEGSNYSLQGSFYAEAFGAFGKSFGRGPWIGLWTGDASDLACATEIGIDTPKGSISILYDLNRMNFGFTIGGKTFFGAGAFAKMKPYHGKIEWP